MNILILCLSFPPLTGGASVYYHWLVKKLSKDKFINNTIVITTLDSSKLVERKENLYIYRIVPNYRTEILPVKIFFFLLSTFSLICILPFLIVKHSIDLLHYDCRKNYFAVSLLKKMKILTIPVVAEARGMSENLPQPNTFEAMIVCSLNIKEMVKKKYRNSHDRIHYMPVPLVINEKNEPGEFNLLSKGEKYILFSGHITSAKGIFELLESIQLLRKEDIKIKLVIIGQSKIFGFDRYIKKIENVLYMGSISHDDALLLIKNCELLILPSKSEGVPRVCLEALFYNRKIIAPPNIQEFELYCPNFILKHINPVSIRDKVIDILKTDDKPNYPISEHNPSKIYCDIKRLYKELVSKSC